jgi:hypothetical protein
MDAFLFSRLLPCIMDRRAFLGIVGSGNAATPSSGPDPPTNVTAPSFQLDAYNLFMACLNRELKTCQERTLVATTSGP